MQEEPGPTKEAGVRQGPTLAGTWGKKGCPGISGLEPQSWQLWHLLPALPPPILTQGWFRSSPICIQVSQAHGTEALRGPCVAQGHPVAGEEAVTGLAQVPCTRWYVGATATHTNLFQLKRPPRYVFRNFMSCYKKLNDRNIY